MNVATILLSEYDIKWCRSHGIACILLHPKSHIYLNFTLPNPCFMLFSLPWPQCQNFISLLNFNFNMKAAQKDDTRLQHFSIWIVIIDHINIHSTNLILFSFCQENCKQCYMHWIFDFIIDLLLWRRRLTLWCPCPLPTCQSHWPKAQH